MLNPPVCSITDQLDGLEICFSWCFHCSDLPLQIKDHSAAFKKLLLLMDKLLIHMERAYINIEKLAIFMYVAYTKCGIYTYTHYIYGIYVVFVIHENSQFYLCRSYRFFPSTNYHVSGIYFTSTNKKLLEPVLVYTLLLLI